VRLRIHIHTGNERPEPTPAPSVRTEHTLDRFQARSPSWTSVVYLALHTRARSEPSRAAPVAAGSDVYLATNTAARAAPRHPARPRRATRPARAAPPDPPRRGPRRATDPPRRGPRRAPTTAYLPAISSTSGAIDSIERAGIV
jgi:hypothetical protein